MKAKLRTTETKSAMAISTDNSKSILPNDYPRLFNDIKARIRTAQVKATFSANQEMILMYWDIGRMIAARQKAAGWGAAFIPRLARDIRNELPEVKGFSERNIGYMISFACEYGEPQFLQHPVAKLDDQKILPQSTVKSVDCGAIVPQFAQVNMSAIMQQLAAQLPWGQNIVLMEKIKNLSIRLWYMQQTLEQGWSRDVLTAMIKNRVHERQGKAITNFYCSVVDDRMRHENDNPTIGLILCQDKNKVVVEYALRGVHKPIGISEYQLARALPHEFKTALPSIAEIEAELSGRKDKSGKKKK